MNDKAGQASSSPRRSTPSQATSPHPGGGSADEQLLRDQTAYASVLAAIRGLEAGLEEPDLWRQFLSLVVEHYESFDASGRALLDCTSGWYSEHDWQGVRVG